MPLRYQKRKVNVYSLNAKLHSFAFSRRGHLWGKCCKLPLCNLANAPGVRIRKSKKTQQKVRKRISTVFFGEMVPIQGKSCMQKFFILEIPRYIVVKKIHSKRMVHLPRLGEKSVEILSQNGKFFHKKVAGKITKRTGHFFRRTQKKV